MGLSRTKLRGEWPPRALSIVFTVAPSGVRSGPGVRSDGSLWAPLHLAPMGLSQPCSGQDKNFMGSAVSKVLGYAVLGIWDESAVAS